MYNDYHRKNSRLCSPTFFSVLFLFLYLSFVCLFGCFFFVFFCFFCVFFFPLQYTSLAKGMLASCVEWIKYTTCPQNWTAFVWRIPSSLYVDDNFHLLTVVISDRGWAVTTTYAISSYHHQRNAFEFRCWWGVLVTTLCDQVCQSMTCDLTPRK